jgi:hypothetical protein
MARPVQHSQPGSRESVNYVCAGQTYAAHIAGDVVSLDDCSEQVTFNDGHPREDLIACLQTAKPEIANLLNEGLLFGDAFVEGTVDQDTRTVRERRRTRDRAFIRGHAARSLTGAQYAFGFARQYQVDATAVLVAPK